MRRNWIKLYVDQCLRGTMIDELANEERWSWIGLLLLAGDCPIEGEIGITNEIGYTNEQISKVLSVPIEIYKIAKDKMIQFNKISVDGSNIIRIVNWKKYQSEYGRQRKYRQSYNSKLHHKVTQEGAKKDKGQKGEGRREKENKKEIKNIGRNEEFDPLFEQFWKGYPKKVAKAYAQEKFMILARAGKMPELIKATNGYIDFLKHKRIHENFAQEPMNPATFLMKERWKDYVNFEYKPPM